MSTGNGTHKQPSFKLSLDSQMLYERIRGANEGEVISYEDLSKVVGRDVRKKRGALITAQRLALSEHAIVFGTIVKEGIKRLSAREIVESSPAVTKKIARAARRQIRKLTSIRETLSGDALVRHNTHVSLMGTLAHICSAPSVKALEGKVANYQKVLPVAKTLEHFRAE